MKGVVSSNEVVVMSILSLIIVIVSLLLMIVSVSLDWKIRIKKVTIAVYWLFCLVGAVLCLIFGFAGQNPIKHLFFSNLNINPVKILVIFISCTSISVFLDKIGFFSYIASIILKKSKSSQTRLFFSFSAIIAVLTIFTSNDILILTFTPFICYFAKNAKIDAKPYILSEFVCANVWSMFFFIDNPTNIYMCSTFNITFVDYALKMALPTIACGVFATLLVYILFKKKLSKPLINDNVQIIKPNKALLSVGIAGLLVMVLFMAISNYINLELWYIPLACSALTYLGSVICIVVQKLKFSVLIESLKSLPYALIPFLLSMSVFIAVLDNVGVISYFASLLPGQNIFIIGFIAFLLGNLVNNIPMTMIFTTTLATISAQLPIIYGTIAASNICALLTPVGSLAGIMFMKILKQNDIEYNFKQFIGYGSIISIPTMLIALVMVAIV